LASFSISDGILNGAKQIPHLPFRNTQINPIYIAIHYTGGSSLQSSIKYLRDVGYSYQILVDRDGNATQGTPLAKRASHAGYSNWKGRDSLNDFSIGISLANLGYLDRNGNKYYRTNSHGDPTTPIFDESEVIKARHWNGHNGSTVKGWEPYTTAQYDTLKELCAVLRAEYPSIIDIMSHEEIAVGRKPDPGMAFKWNDLYPLFPNRQNDLGPTYEVRVPPGDNLHVRKGPNGSWGVKDRLANGTRVHLRSFAYKYQGRTPVKSVWASISLIGEMGHHGFVHSGFLNQT